MITKNNFVFEKILTLWQKDYFIPFQVSPKEKAAKLPAFDFTLALN